MIERGGGIKIADSCNVLAYEANQLVHYTTCFSCTSWAILSCVSFNASFLSVHLSFMSVRLCGICLDIVASFSLIVLVSRQQMVCCASIYYRSSVTTIMLWVLQISVLYIRSFL